METVKCCDSDNLSSWDPKRDDSLRSPAMLCPHVTSSSWHGNCPAPGQAPPPPPCADTGNTVVHDRARGNIWIKMHIRKIAVRAPFYVLQIRFSPFSAQKEFFFQSIILLFYSTPKHSPLLVRVVDSYLLSAISL